MYLKKPRIAKLCKARETERILNITAAKEPHLKTEPDQRLQPRLNTPRSPSSNTISEAPHKKKKLIPNEETQPGKNPQKAMNPRNQQNLSPQNDNYITFTKNPVNSPRTNRVSSPRIANKSKAKLIQVRSPKRHETGINHISSHDIKMLHVSDMNSEYSKTTRKIQLQEPLE